MPRDPAFAALWPSCLVLKKNGFGESAKNCSECLSQEWRETECVCVYKQVNRPNKIILIGALRKKGRQKNI